MARTGPLLHRGRRASRFLLLRFGDVIISASGSAGWWLYGGEAETARNLLSALLSGLMTMTSLVVSVTFVILTLAANQLGPRLIAIFMSDKQIQSCWAFLSARSSTFILVMRSIGDTLGANGVRMWPSPQYFPPQSCV